MSDWKKTDYPNPPEWKKSEQRWADSDSVKGGWVAAGLVAGVVLFVVCAVVFFRGVF